MKLDTMEMNEEHTWQRYVKLSRPAAVSWTV